MKTVDSNNIMFRSTFLLMFWCLAVICEELTHEIRQKIIPLEEIADKILLENWENYKLGKMPKTFL